MRSVQTFKILFWADLKKAREGKALLYARIKANQKRATISLKRRVPGELWDQKSQRVLGTTAKARQTNLYLDQVQNQLFSIYHEFKYQGKKITAELIKSKYSGEEETGHTLKELIAYHGEKIEKTLASGSIRNFGITEGYIVKFLSSRLKTSDIYLKDLNYKFICDFEIFLSWYYPKGHPRTMSHNTVMKHIQRLRKMVTIAYHLEWLDRDLFLRWRPTFEKKQREFLTGNELSNLETYTFPCKRLERVCDLFLFSCYTGISYADIIPLTSHHILIGIDGNRWIHTHRQKTKTKIRIPLLEKAEVLIKKYEGHPLAEIAGTLFPPITNIKLNHYLKEVAEMVGIRKNLTFHMARYTFATTVTLNNGVPIETVSKLLGHTKIATTQIYARVLDKKIGEDMEALQQILNSKKKTK